MTGTNVLAVATVAALAFATPSSAQDARSQKVFDTGPEWSGGFAEPASGRFFVYTGSSTINVYNRQTRKTATIAAPLFPAYGGALSISRSGRRLIFPASDATQRFTHIWSVDLDTITGAPLNAPHRVSVSPAVMASISPDGRWIAMSTDEKGARSWMAGSRLVVIPSDGGDERMLDSALGIGTPRWSIDGKTLFYARGRGHGAALVRIAASGGKPDSLATAWGVFGMSPDGKYIAFQSSMPRSSSTTVRFAETNGKIVGEFAYGEGEGRIYGWSRDGRALIGFRRLEPTTFKTVSLADERVSDFAVTEQYGQATRVSPDGSRLGMVAPVDGRPQFVVFDLKTKRRSVVPAVPSADPRTWQWSPDGSRIAYLAVDTATQHHELYSLDLASARATHLAGFDNGLAGNAVAFRWRSDSKAIDFIAPSPASQTAELHRVTLAGAQSVIRPLPPTRHGNGTDGGYRFISDSVLLVGGDQLQAVPIPAGEPRTVAPHEAFWLMSWAENMLSPDGKWVAFGSVGMIGTKKAPQWAIASVDGKTFRLLGEAQGCDVWPQHWLPDSRAYVAVGAASCNDWREDEYVVPIDGSPARRIHVPDNEGITLAPDGQSLLVAADDPKLGSIVQFDVTGVIGNATQAGKTKKGGGQ